MIYLIISLKIFIKTLQTHKKFSSRTKIRVLGKKIMMEQERIFEKENSSPY